MQIFYKRPLFVALFVFLSADLLFTFISPEIRLYTALLFAGSLLLAAPAVKAASKNKITPLPFLLGALAVLLAFLHARQFADQKLDRIESAAAPAVIVGQIRTCEFRSEYENDYIVDIHSFNGENLRCALLLTFSDEINVRKDDLFTATVQILPFEKSEYGFNTRAYRISDGILAKATVLSYHADGVGRARLQSYFEEIADCIGGYFDRHFEKASAALAKALLLGDKSSLSNTFRRDVRRLGISHILAVSGTHFSVLLGMAAMILSLFGCPPKIARVLLILISLCYMAITGFSPSVVRAGLMAVCGFLAFLFGRQKDGLTALLAAVCVYIFIAPHTVYSVGLWLSFSSSFVILVSLEFLQSAFAKSKNILRRLLRLIIWRIYLSLLIFIVTLPICAVAFGEVSVGCFLGNLTVVPLMEVYIYIVVFAGIAPNIPFVADMVARYTDFIQSCAGQLSDHPDMLISVKYDFVVPLLCAGILISFLLICLRLRRKAIVLLPLLLSFALTVGGILYAQTADYKRDTLYFYSCFGGEGILLRSQNRTILIDISDGQSHIRKEADLLSANANCPEIYGYAFTHYHKKHITSLRALCTSQKLTKIYLPPALTSDEADIRAELLGISAENNVSVEETAFGVPIAYGNTEITLLPPKTLKKSTHPVYMVKIEKGEKSVLYCPASACGTADLPDGDLPDILLIGFHTPRQNEPFTPMPAPTIRFASEKLAALSTVGGTYVHENEFEEFSLN